MENQRPLDLEVIATQISDGINAIGIMTMGLFSAVWHYLSQAKQELQRKAESYLSTK